MNVKEINNTTVAVWFSCGAASAVAAKRTVDLYNKNYYVRVLNNPVQEEDEDNRRFLKDVEEWIGVEIEEVRSKKYPNQSCKEVWDSRRYMSGISGAPCTLELKKRARQDWERNNDVNFHVLGFTSDEEKRHQRFIRNEPLMKVIPILIREGITKADCYKILMQAGIDLPRVYKMGYPNANCIGCVKASSPTYWNHVRKMHPEVFKDRAKQSREIGAKLVKHKGERLYLDELDPEAKGRPLKNMDFECGLFCDSGGRGDND